MIPQRQYPDPAAARPTSRAHEWTYRRAAARIGLLIPPVAERGGTASCQRSRVYGDCGECDQLWAEFSQANQRLLAAVETKYAHFPSDPLRDAHVLIAIDDRQRAKHRILVHQRWAHPE